MALHYQEEPCFAAWFPLQQQESVTADFGEGVLVSC